MSVIFFKAPMHKKIPFECTFGESIQITEFVTFNFVNKSVDEHINPEDIFDSYKNVLLPLGSADEQIRQCYIRNEVGEFQCLVCNKKSRTQQDIYRHVEAKHVNTGGYTCPECNKYCPTMNSFRNHKFRHHRNT